jgi:sugar O-acyltransferase (sialic acid O-acetyltransferase NeuD family)
MQDLIICSVGCHAMEIAEIVERINRVTPTWNLLGFFSEKKRHEKCRGLTLNGYRVLGTIDDLTTHRNAALAIGNEFQDPFPVERAVTIIDPTAFVSRSAKLGNGCIIYPGCFIGYNAVLGNRVFSLSGSVINHDAVLEEGVCLCSSVALAGGVRAEAGAYLGQACTVRQYVRLGKDSFIGMGAVVVGDVPANAVMVGNPAHKLKDRYCQTASRRP